MDIDTIITYDKDDIFEYYEDKDVTDLTRDPIISILCSNSNLNIDSSLHLKYIIDVIHHKNRDKHRSYSIATLVYNILIGWIESYQRPVINHYEYYTSIDLDMISYPHNPSALFKYETVEDMKIAYEVFHTELIPNLLNMIFDFPYYLGNDNIRLFMSLFMIQSYQFIEITKYPSYFLIYMLTCKEPNIVKKLTKKEWISVFGDKYSKIIGDTIRLKHCLVDLGIFNVK